MNKYYLLSFALIATISLLFANSTIKTPDKALSHEIMECEVCDPGSTTPSVLIDYAQTEGNRCCIYFIGTPNTFFQVSYACDQSFLCERTTDSSGIAKCCYSGIATCGEIAIVTGSTGCECYATPTCT